MPPQRSNCTVAAAVWFWFCFGVVGALRNGFFPGWPGFSRAVDEGRAATTVNPPSEGRFFFGVFYVRASLGVFGC